MFGCLTRLIPGFVACLALWVVGETLATSLGLPLPGGVVGFAILLAGLAWRPSLLDVVAPGATIFLDNLILFFLPAVLSVIAYPAFFGALGVKLLIAIIAGTVIMMAVVGLLAEWLLRRQIDGTNEIR